MTTAISYFITGGSAFALLALWFYNVYQILSRKRKAVFHAEEQVRLLRDCFRRMRNSPDEAPAGQMLETSIQTYMETERIYNETLLKPACRFPGALMRFCRAECAIEEKEEDPVIYICEDCGFVFYGAEEIRECSFCGKQRIRASEREEAEALQPFLECRKPINTTPGHLPISDVYDIIKTK